MNNERYDALLALKAAGLVEEYMARCGATLNEALSAVYHSALYKVLSREESKIWHFSPALLTDCLVNEQEKGFLELPDE